MSSENTISNQNPLAEVGLLLNDEASLNMNLMRETYNKFNSVTYSTEELNTFKDNILSLLKERDKIFLNKLSDYKTSTDKIKFEFNSENKLTNSKFSKIIDTQAKMTSRLDQLSDYENFVTKTKEKLVSHDIRLTNIRNDFSLATQKYDKIYLDNLELPGYIGRCAKYKNCQSFFLDVIKDLAKLNIYREKNILDLKMYKDKLETIISSMNSILDNNNESQIKYINEMKEKILKDCKSMFEDVSDGMKDIRVENSKYAVDLISTSMNLSKKWEKLEKIKEELLEKFNYDVNKYQMLTDDTIKSFEEFKNEYGVIRRKFMELAEFIKDIRFRKNIGGNVKKKEVKQMVKKMAADFAERVCEVEAAEIDRTHNFPMETWHRIAELGLLRVNHSEAYGGVGKDPIMEMIVIEELSKASLTHGAAYALLGHGFPTFIEMFGTEEQKQKYIPEILSADKIGGFCLTEPGAGSDASGVRTTSRKENDIYVINGTKQFVTAGDISDYLLVVAQADALSGERGYTGFIVDTTRRILCAQRRMAHRFSGMYRRLQISRTQLTSTMSRRLVRLTASRLSTT